MSGVNGGKVMREWLIGEGYEVRSRGMIPGPLAEKYYEAFPGKRPAVDLLPGPDEVDEWDDLGEIEIDAPAPQAPQSPAEPPRGPSRYIAEPEPPEAASGGAGPVPDPPPGHARKEWAKDTARGGGAPRKATRVTAGIRGDINSKISLVLEILFRTWQARDPICGGTAVGQRPDIADAFTEIVCGSPDLVAWFTGSGGQFMLWLNLCAACAPVASVVAAHHVYHSIEEVPEDPQQPQYETYAA